VVLAQLAFLGGVLAGSTSCWPLIDTYSPNAMMSTTPATRAATSTTDTMASSAAAPRPLTANSTRPRAARDLRRDVRGAATLSLLGLGWAFVR
jgi:hypothetical protein